MSSNYTDATYSMASSGTTDMWSQVYGTFVASIRSVGTACTLAAVGVYLHRRGFIVGDGKRTLALISQQVTIPLLFCTKIIYCNQDWSSDPCPDITSSLEDVWVLLLWPAYVVGVGFLVGYCAAKLAGTPQHQLRAVLVACGFGNSTGLPITLLSVVHANFANTNTDLGRIDPTLFLSVYLLLYPVLQWGIGGWLLAPELPTTTPAAADSSFSAQQQQQVNSNDYNTTDQPLPNHVLNVKTSDSYNYFHRGMAETDASMYMSVQENLHQLSYQHPNQATYQQGATVAAYVQQPSTPSTTALPIPTTDSYHSIGMALSRDSSIMGLAERNGRGSATSLLHQASTELSTTPTTTTYHESIDNSSTRLIEQLPLHRHQERLWDTLQVIASRCLQPPVVGALVGMFVASQPSIRGLFVDLVDRSDDAPLEWMFDALYNIGQAAVPINMIILGCNLSSSYTASSAKKKDNALGQEDEQFFSRSTMWAIVMAKMVVMPLIGFVSAYLLKVVWWEHSIPDEIGGSFYLVIMIVFLTPTANNVMVMVELSSSSTKEAGNNKNDSNKEAMAQCIAWQYAVAPLILSVTMTAAVCIAVEWS